MRRIFAVVLLSTLILCGLAAAQGGGFRPKVRTFAETFAEQRRVIGTWCRLDFDGARLQKDGWTRFAPLTDMSSPEFTSFKIVARYQVMQPEAPTNEILVTFYQLGEFRPETGFVSGNRIETVTFRTGEREGEVIIREVLPTQPQVSKQAAVAWLRQQADAAKSAVDRHPFEQALKVLAPPQPNQPVPPGNSK